VIARGLIKGAASSRSESTLRKKAFLLPRRAAGPPCRTRARARGFDFRRMQARLRYFFCSFCICPPPGGGVSGLLVPSHLHPGKNPPSAGGPRFFSCQYDRRPPILNRDHIECSALANSLSPEAPEIRAAGGFCSGRSAVFSPHPGAPRVP